MSVEQYNREETDRQQTDHAIERRAVRCQLRALAADPPMLALMKATLDIGQQVAA